MICSRCIMDDKADDYISFNESGQCNYCTEALKCLDEFYFPNKTGEKKLSELLRNIKHDGENKKYDCIIGLSGGLDSSYLTYLSYCWKLRPLIVHIDDGYDIDISKRNIERIINKTGFDYEVIKPDEEQFNDLLLSYLKAGVPNIAVPQDNILFAFLYKKMKEYNIKYFLDGTNWAMESITQKGNYWRNSDKVNIFSIHKKFGTKPIDKLEFFSTVERYLNKYVLGWKIKSPLNLINYNKENAFKELNDFCGFEYYGGKHLENALTAFIQLRWFPEKFGVDKRKWHLSSLIISGQLSRNEALEMLKLPICDKTQMSEYENLICKNLNITHDQLEEYIIEPSHQHYEFDIEDNTFTFKILTATRNLRKSFLNLLGSFR